MVIEQSPFVNAIPTPGNAELQLGKSERENPIGERSNLEWYSRGYLPHCDRIGLLQSITFRLADSLPQEVLTQFELEIASVAEDRREQCRRKLIEKYMDSGMGCCALQHPVVADIVQNSFFAFDGVKYHLIAWCIMPNHVHIFVEPLIELGKIVQSWKSFTGRWVMKHNAELELGVPGIVGYSHSALFFSVTGMWYISGKGEYSNGRV
ncbi:MAG: transposase [Chlorobiaceae bacterium]|nr:transposase [Chlorobiaceae bacterium]